jgi:hypothetical protein
MVGRCETSLTATSGCNEDGEEGRRGRQRRGSRVSLPGHLEEVARGDFIFLYSIVVCKYLPSSIKKNYHTEEFLLITKF